MNPAEREPRRARYLIPRDTPRRGEFVAALVLAGILAHLLLAQLTILLAIALHLISRLTRWRPLWLAGPAATGLVWVLAIGPGAALAGFTDGPRQVLGYLAGALTDPATLFHPGRAFAGIGHWLPRQAPVAMIAASAEAVVAWWLRWLHAGEAGFPDLRPGLVVLGRRKFTTARVSAGGVVSRAGACLGVDWGTGRPAEVTWRAAEGGVLVAGAVPAAVSAASFQLVHAAIRRRKPVIVVDLAGTERLAESLAAVCAEAGAPLGVFGPGGPGCYEPLRGGDPGRKAALVMGMIDWTAVTDSARRTCAGYLNDLFAVAAAAPGDPRAPALDDVVHLLSPAALRARMARVPPYHPRRRPLAERVRASVSLLAADPATAAFLAGELTGLRASPLGRWLRPDARPDAGQARISLSGVVRDRAVVLFSLDQSRYGRPAQMIANLVALDATAVSAQAHRLGVAGDGLAWFGNCEVIAATALADLISTGSQAGLATVLSTVSAEATMRVAALANVLVIHRLDDHDLAGRLAGGGLGGAGPAGTAGSARPVAVAEVSGVSGVSGRGGPAALATALPAAPADPPGLVPPGLVTGAQLCDLASDQFVLSVKGADRRVVPLGRFIPAGLP
ncbi:MAG TPA: hypothetical protein VMV92_37600 [Streptosporangiaceae bacterium]|nr:hypothetical protein [Streptosporangiaceae bacterium]